MSAATIAIQLGGAGLVSADGWARAPCPSHHGTANNLALKLTGSGQLAVRCWSNRCSPASILRSIDAKLGTRFSCRDAAADFADDAPIPVTPIGAEAGPDSTALALWQAEGAGYDAMRRAEAKTYAAEHLFESAKPIERGDLVDRYLRKRGIALDRYPAALRLHPALWHLESKKTWPGLVAKVTASDGQLVTLHRTFLNAETAGKAPVKPVRKILSSPRGGAVRLYGQLGDTLLVAEGIETTLAALILARWVYTGWAALSTSGLVALQVPRRFRRVVIAGDNDGNGAGPRAAMTLAKRLRAAGRRVDIHLPPKIGTDWNDVLIEQTRQGGAA
jgi:hypothetical protein